MTATRSRTNRIVLAVTGCVQAEVTPRLVRSLIQHPDVGKQEVVVVATPSALQFFEKKEVEKITGRKVFVEHKDGTEEFSVPHINLTEWADAVLVYPASANTIAKCAHGICDTLVCTLILGSQCPVYFGPSMNEAMYGNKITQGNLSILKKAGYRIIPRELAKVFIHAKKATVEKMYCTEAMVLSICEEIVQK